MFSGITRWALADIKIVIYSWTFSIIFAAVWSTGVEQIFDQNNSSDREYCFQVSAAEEPRDTITWARHQMRSPAITFHTIRSSGQKIYLILFIKNDLTIVLINKKHNRAAAKIYDFLYNEIFFRLWISKFFNTFRKTNWNLKLKLYTKNHKNSNFFFNNLAVRITDNWHLVLNFWKKNFKIFFLDR